MKNQTLSNYASPSSKKGVESIRFNLMMCDLYFMILIKVFTNQILTGKTYFMNHIVWTKQKIMVLKPANKSQIIWQRHNFKKPFTNNFHHHPYPNRNIFQKIIPHILQNLFQNFLILRSQDKFSLKHTEKHTHKEDNKLN